MYLENLFLMTVFDRTIIQIGRRRRNNHFNNKNRFKYSALFCNSVQSKAIRDRHKRKSNDIIEGNDLKLPILRTYAILPVRKLKIHESFCTKKSISFSI